ncbi:MAG: hypothetical protein WCS66_06340, partial [Bacteroidales bacterium]
MKNTWLIQCRIIFTLSLACFALALNAEEKINNLPPKIQDAQPKHQKPRSRLQLLSAHPQAVIGPEHPEVIFSRNFSGFETGQVIKIEGTYHMFVNEMFVRPFRDLRISYWTSRDALNWERQSVIRESIPGRSPYNPRSEVWVTGVEFNEEENAWNIFYVAYRAGNEAEGEIARSDYSGRIWRAKSVIPGMKGIAG